ncbi:MAG: hypothetical protein WDW36_002285 [Sanguina aurantia]
MALKMVEQRRKHPPLMNDRALFTKAAPFGDKDDPYYHSPSSRIGGNYSPHAALAAAILFEEFPAGPNAPRTRAHPTRSAPGDGKGYHVGSRVLSPRPGSLPPLKAISPGRTAAAGAEPVSPGGPGEEVDGNSLSRSAKDARTGPLSTADTSMLVDAILRYYYYIEVGLDEAHVAPFRQEWAANVLQLVPQGPSEHVSQAFYDTLVCSTLEEMCHEYVYSMKKAMIDYVITSSVERARLNLGPLEQLLALPTPTQESWRAVVGRCLPPAWHINVDTAREEVAWTLQTLSANALELSKLWINSGFSRALLVDTSAEGFVSRLPMQAQAFRSHQAEVCELLKSSLWTSWAPKSVEIFNRLPPVFINGDADAYYRSIATMQGNQLRGLVQRSLQAYVAFFQLHAAVPQVDPQQDTLLWSVPPLFVLDLEQAHGHLRAHPRLPTHRSPSGGLAAVRRSRSARTPSGGALDAQVLAVAGLPRIGANMAGTTSFTSSSAAAAGPQPGGYSSSVIPTTGLQEEDVVVAREAVLAIVKANAAAPRKLLALFEPWLWLLKEDAEVAIHAFAERDPEPTLIEFQAEIDRLRSAAGTIRRTCTDDVRTGLYTIRCRAFKEQLAVAAEGLSVRLLDEVRSGVRHANVRITEEYQVMTLEVGKASHSGEEALGLKRYLTKAHSDQERLREGICRNREKEDFLMAHRFPIPEEDFEISMKAYEAPRRMVEVMKQAALKANSEHREYESQLKKRRKEFGEQLEGYAKDLESYHTKAEIIKRDVIASEVNELGDRLRAATAEAEYINTQEKMFGWVSTKYGNVARMAAAAEPYIALWTTLSSSFDKLSVWMNGPFARLDPEEVEAETSEAFRKLYKLTKLFGGQGGGGGEVREGPLAMAEEGKARVAAFQEHMPLIGAVCNAGLRDRHWAALAGIVGFEIKRDEVTSLKRLLDHDISAHLPRVTELSDSASREWSIEKAMDSMTRDWEGLCFELGPWKETGTFILKGGPVDVAQGLLDDHIVKSQAMSASPFAQPFMDRLGPWESKLVRFQDILEAWLCCQGKWLYLEPIFGADEIMKQIPREGAAFRDMDDIWRRIMQKVKANAVMTEVAELPGLLEDLQHCNKQLDVVEKGLNDFLDTKKLAFPRFFFLSNDELLEILSEARDPVNIQPFVKKCFEAVRELVFEADGEISGLVSVEGEKVPFVEAVNPAATGAVECWLLAVESAIRRTLHQVAGAALEAYAREQRSSWILHWPGQLVLNCSQVYWTREVTQAISSGGAQGLSGYADKCTSELNQIVSLVRGQLTSIERATCGALVVIDVHARDVVTSMAAEGVADIRDFKWESQLRYYWEHNDAPPSGVSPQETLMVRMINAEALYGYEYLGNSGRLVITPLTDRCYRTLMGAIHMNLGGAPAGPAGTGKTETTKDLSKALAIQCVVFNCSDGLDFKAMGKFFKGLACSGAWACFDEFNRIELEVLSVVAQQILTIIRAKSIKAKLFVFEGVEMKLVLTCNVFITMNPGYAGRSELPDNLKALFRDVAMMVPDYAMIAEIMLYSYGYLEARSMARKLVQTYRLCSEQLSSQDHYDYGMRAVVSVLRAAGNLKRSFGEAPEDVLMLRAINDVNLPKFLDQDVPLFNGILSDLFPGVSLPEVDYEQLRFAIIDNCLRANLQPLESFISKTIQLYEMIVVRHGLMLVGLSFGMKTSSWRVLAQALSDLAARNQNGEFHTKTYVLNPKSVTMGQLYGAEDAVSKEWTDGVLAVLFRNAARDTSTDRKWVIFDGPVDAIWIENMNTVLDDNRKLCLNSGEIVAMQGLMNMVFEVQDLAVASPATVSRCGMVYVQPALLGWRPVMLSWLATLPPAVTDAQKQQMVCLFDWLVPPCLRVALTLVRSPLPMQDINLAVSCMRLLRAHLGEWADDAAALGGMTEQQQAHRIQALFLLSLVWSVGGGSDEEGRRRFDACLRRLMADDAPAELKLHVSHPAVKVTAPFPEGRLVYDFVFDKERSRWAPWMDGAAGKALDVEAEYTSIIVPTVDTVRYAYLLHKFVTHGVHCLFVGPTGTGKSVYVKRHLQESLPASYVHMLMTFSAQTSANITQDIIDGKLDKRRRGVAGPPQGKKMVIFVDDLNMPQVEEYGAQPPIELLRQFMDHGGWTCSSWRPWGRRGGGCNSVTNRYLRHFSVVSMTAFDNENLGIIFTALVDWWFRKHSYPPSLTRLGKPLVAASLEVYRRAQATLLPTPTKSHYTFNLRDVSKVFQGMTKAAGSVADSSTMVRLWTHEVLRVFHDRLVDDEDRSRLAATLAQLSETHFKEQLGRLLGVDTRDDGDAAALGVDKQDGDAAALLGGLRALIFGDFMVPGQDPKVYCDIKDQSVMLTVVNEYLADFNATSKKPMNLVIFQFALEHIARICRVITSPGGNALLVGVGGSGRQSLTRLAAFIEEFEVFQIQISKTYGKMEWHEDIKKVLKTAGESNRPVVFLFADTQIKEESFVEDISNLLNTHEVPNLMQSADLVPIYESIAVRAKAAGMDGSRDQLYNFFVQEVRKNMHIVLSFSPVGDAFRERLRKFPSLVNCTTIDWFTAWPTDALTAVAQSFLANLDGIGGEVASQLPELCVVFHQTMHELSARYLSEQRRYYYVTPTSYLELLLSYKGLLGKRQSEVMAVKRRYEVGLERLMSTEASVQGMKETLTALQPQLEESTRQTEAAMLVITKESADADVVKQVVSEEEAVASREAAKVMAIKRECEGDLAEAMPLLEAALKALDTLTKNDITEVKGMKSPPSGVKLVLEALCIMKGVKPVRMKDPASGRMVDDYWEASKGMLVASDFLDALRAFDKDHIDPATIKKIRPYIDNPEFMPEKILSVSESHPSVEVLSVSKAAYGLCSWVRAMEAYDRVAKVVEPKRAKLKESEGELAVVMSALRSKQAELREVMDKLAALDADLQEKKAKKAKLEADVAMCTVKLDRAAKLISGLGGEKARWTAAALSLGEQHVKLTGDVLLSAGQIAYLGPFTALYRADAVGRWVGECRSRGVPCDPGFRLEWVLGDAVQTRQWNIWGLPRDGFSTDNGIAMDQGGAGRCASTHRRAGGGGGGKGGAH